MGGGREQEQATQAKTDTGAVDDDFVANAAVVTANAHQDARALADTPSPEKNSKATLKKPVTPPPGAAQAKQELDADIADGIKHPEKLATWIAMLSDDDRWGVAGDHWNTIVDKCNAEQVIAVGEVLEIGPMGILKAVLPKKPTLRQTQSVLARVGSDELVAAAADDAFLQELKKALPGTTVVNLRQMALYNIGKSGPLMKWFISTATPLEIWRAIRGTSAKEDIVQTLEANNLWGWVSHLKAPGMTSFDAYGLNELAKLAPEGPVKTQFEALAAGAAQHPANPMPENWDEAQKLESSVSKPAAAELKKLLAGGGTLKKDKLFETAARAKHDATTIAKDADAKKRLIGLLTAEEVAQFIDILQFSKVDKVDWLLATPKVTPALLQEPLEMLEDAEAGAIFGSADRVKKLHAKLGDTHLRSLVGGDRGMQKAAVANPELLEWLLADASPQELFKFAVAGKDGDSVVNASKQIAKLHGYNWVYELKNLEKDTNDVRRLAAALPDKAAAKHLMTYAIEDWAVKPGIIDAPKAADPGLLESSEDHLRSSVRSGDNNTVAREAAELSDAERASIGKDRDLVGKSITAASGGNSYDAVRTARDLGGTLPETLAAIGNHQASVDNGSFRTYARERPSAEHATVAGDATLAAAAEKLLNFELFSALPGLREPSLLAKALASNAELLGWIERRTHPLQAITHLGHPQVADVAAAAFEKHGVDLIKALPRGMTQDQKAATMRIGASATGGKLQEAVSSRVVVDKEDDNSDTARILNTKRHLRDVIDELRSAKQFDQKLLIAVCNAHPAEQVHELLADTKVSQRIEFLRTALSVSPLVVFPHLAAKPPVELFTNRHVFEWLIYTEEPIAVLRMIGAQPRAVGQIAAAIELDTPGASHWLVNLPDGYGMSDADEAIMYKIYREVTSDAGALRVFSARFGRTPEGKWTRESLNKMWSTLARLPDRQVEGNLKLSGLSTDEADVDGLGGFYSPTTGVVNVGQGKSEAERSKYADQPWVSKVQLAATLGVDEAEVDRRVTATLIEKRVEKGVEQFRIKPIPEAGFTDTLLHETGHAVDAMLGNRTDIVFGQAGWKTYGSGDFDTWAKDMDAWSGGTVNGDDRAEIKGLFEQRLKSSGAISGPSFPFGDLPASDHAINKPKNKGSFIAKAIHKSERPFEYTEPVEHNGRVFIMNHYYGLFHSYDAKVTPMLPRAYAGFAPEEFFAECYTEFYRDESNKGGNLPAWVKNWFVVNVDQIGHGPKRP